MTGKPNFGHHHIAALRAFLVLTCLTCLVMCGLPCWSASDKPVNFIFLVDVSGSMVSKSTMVTDGSGGTITLFEALRKAVQNIVSDSRLIKQGSRISFITFGTTVSEKSDWPTSITTDEDRTKLVQLIGDPTALSADRKGDTYMGGALNQALVRADNFLLKSDPCTTTFIMMLTDGWDEPPAAAQYKAADVAQQIVRKKETIKRKVGIDTWQTAVIGLKRLPTSKVGTTTAAQLSKMINGTFLDITQEKGKSVSDQIYLALSKILENQRGTFSFPGNKKDQVVDFGTVDGGGVAHGSFDIELLACDKEEISAIQEASAAAPANYWPGAREKVFNKNIVNNLLVISELPADAVKIIPDQMPLVVSPIVDSEGRRQVTGQKVKLTLQAGSSLPVGNFIGRLKLLSSARIPDSIPYVVSAPARLATKDDLVKVTVKRKGKLTKEDTETELTITFMQSEGSPPGANYKIEIPAPSAESDKRSHEALASKCFNSGKPTTLNFDTNKQKSATATVPIIIPAEQSIGTYKGKFKFDISGPSEITAPTEVPFEITLTPTDWERIAPIAVPMILLLIVGIVIYIYLYAVSQRRK